MNLDCFLNQYDDPKANTHLPDSLYRQLPYPLNDCCMGIKNIHERNLFLLSALTITSGMLPHVQGKYANELVAPHLYLFVRDRHGINNGTILLAKSLAKVLDKRTFIPLTTTKHQLLKRLCEHKGQGIIYETDGETLSRVVKRHRTTLTNLLSKAYRHESVSYTGNDYDTTESTIEDPRLAVLLSGNLKQLMQLIPNAEHELFSRFCYFITEETKDFQDPFAAEYDDYERLFSTAADHYTELYNTLNGYDGTIHFKLSTEQQQRFTTMMVALKDIATDFQGTQIHGTVDRMGITCYRIAMILTTLRAFNNNQLGDTITCTDEDFNHIQALGTLLLHYNLFTNAHIEDEEEKKHKKKQRKPGKNSTISKAEGARIIELHRSGFSLRQISYYVFGTPTKYSTVQRYIKKSA